MIACLKVASEELFVTCGLVMVHANNREDAVIDDASNQNIIMKDFMAADGVAASSVIEVRGGREEGQGRVSLTLSRANPRLPPPSPPSGLSPSPE